MSRAISCLLMSLALLAGAAAFAQAPTGIITGTIADESGAVIPNATIVITNKDTSSVRTVTANGEGLFSAPALPAGVYQVRAEVPGFKALMREATVVVGSTTTVNLQMQLGGTKDLVIVEAATAQVNYENHAIEGVIERSTIQELPLNGRSFMQLASLEPGVTITPGSTAQFNTLFTVSILGAGNHTVFTVDGGNISDNIDTSGGISSMNFSQETVQEFELSSANFDISTPIAAGGGINIVTRSGTNAFHGSAYFFYRDHNMAAYPNLVRDPTDPSPFFVRRNPGVWLGGPIKKDKLFFFFNYEFTNQVQAVQIYSTTPSFAPLNHEYPSPYVSKTFSGKVDYHIDSKNTLFVRYSHDGNDGFSQSLEFGDPSNWPHNRNWADQSIIGITTVFTPALVNDLRLQYNYWNNHNDQAVPSDCSLPCVAGSLPNIFYFYGSNFPAVGPNFNAPQARNTRRYELVETLSWQKGSHRLKFGGDLNPTYSAGLWGFCTPMCVGAFTPEATRALLGNALGPAFNFLFPNLPTTLTSDASVLNLPVLPLASSIFSGIHVGAVPLPATYDYSEGKKFNQYRAFFQDTWKIKPNLTVNYGVAWNAQIGFYNNFLAKPQFLAPILGGGSNLQPTLNNTHEFQPAIGFAWSPAKNQKWVIRGGAGIYWDGTPGYYKLREAASIGPPGTASNTLSATSFTNIYPGILDFSLGGVPIPVGANLPVGHLTNMTVGQFLNLVNQELPAIQSIVSPVPAQRSGPITVTGIDLVKQGVELYPHDFPLPRSYQTSIGVQHELPWGMVAQVDYVRRLGENVSLGEVDLNLFSRVNSAGAPAPVIPLCKPSQNLVASAQCSTGAITFWEDQGRQVYNGLLVKVQKRFANRFAFQASYALQRDWSENYPAPGGTTQVWDLTNWKSSYGQDLAHHNFNFAGTVELPWGFSLSVNSSFISSTPQGAQVSGLALPGTVPSTTTEPLPGIPWDSLNAGTSKSALAAAVNAFNGSVPAAAKLAPPANYTLAAPIFSQDFRLTKKFTFRERYQLSVMAEMFNTFNIANLIYGSYTLDSAYSTSQAFGQPTARIGQSLGQGGPRAVQLGARISF
jgi:Carboxypeptidase regulatory-like domain